MRWGGAPFFLAFPMIWLRLRSPLSKRAFTPAGRRVIWILASLSIGGTILVELSFLLHLAGTTEWPSLSILTLGFDRDRQRCIVVSATARYIADECLLDRPEHCLSCQRCALPGCLRDAGATGPFSSRSGWLITIVIVWPMALYLVWIFIQTFREQPARSMSSAV